MPRDDASPQPTETEVMAHLERIIRAAEEAQAWIQDDSRITGERDRRSILLQLLVIRSAVLEIERLLQPHPSKRR